MGVGKREFDMKERSCVAIGVALAVCCMPLVTDAADYSCWRNVDGSGMAADSGLELVDSWDDARFLWVSEEPLPIPTPTRKGWPARENGAGGYGNPMIVDGRIYTMVFTPKPPLAKFDARGLPRPDTVTEKDYKWLLDADDVVVCIG